MATQLPRDTWGPDEYPEHSKGQTFHWTASHTQVTAFFVVACMIFAAVVYAAVQSLLPYLTAVVIVSAVFAAFGALVWRTARGTLQA